MSVVQVPPTEPRLSKTSASTPNSCAVGPIGPTTTCFAAAFSAITVQSSETTTNHQQARHRKPTPEKSGNACPSSSAKSGGRPSRHRRWPPRHWRNVLTKQRQAWTLTQPWSPSLTPWCAGRGFTEGPHVASSSWLQSHIAELMDLPTCKNGGILLAGVSAS